MNVCALGETEGEWNPHYVVDNILWSEMGDCRLRLYAWVEAFRPRATGHGSRINLLRQNFDSHVLMSRNPVAIIITVCTQRLVWEKFLWLTIILKYLLINLCEQSEGEGVGHQKSEIHWGGVYGWGGIPIGEILFIALLDHSNHSVTTKQSADYHSIKQF